MPVAVHSLLGKETQPSNISSCVKLSDPDVGPKAFGKVRYRPPLSKQLGAQPGLKVINDRSAPVLAHSPALVGAAATDFLFDCIQTGDALETVRMVHPIGWMAFAQLYEYRRRVRSYPALGRLSLFRRFLGSARSINAAVKASSRLRR